MKNCKHKSFTFLQDCEFENEIILLYVLVFECRYKNLKYSHSSRIFAASPIPFFITFAIFNNTIDCEFAATIRVIDIQMSSSIFSVIGNRKCYGIYSFRNFINVGRQCFLIYEISLYLKGVTFLGRRPPAFLNEIVDGGDPLASQITLTPTGGYDYILHFSHIQKFTIFVSVLHFLGATATILLGDS